MGNIGGWWVSSHESRPGEETIASYHVNYLRAEGRPLGGKLYLTDQRLLFSPHVVDSVLGGEKAAIDVRDVDGVRRSDAPDSDDPDPPDSIRLELVDGSHESFVVDDPEAALEDVRSVL